MPLAKTLSRILRWPLSLIPPDTQVRILRGPLRGKKWIVGAGPNAHWAGTYEVSRLRDFQRALRPGAVVYDIGANVGIYSLLAGFCVGPTGRVYAFEPLPRNVGYLRRHLAFNNLENCTVIEKAVCDQAGSLAFSAAGWNPSMARLSSDGEFMVPTTTLDACVYGSDALRPPDVLKIDVEGAELQVLQGGLRAISEFHPAIFLELHSAQLHNDCRAFLLDKGYGVEEGYGRLTARWRRAN